MTAVEALNNSIAPGGVTSAQASSDLSDLSSSDFFQLLITELTNQDPLEPTDNQDLLKQIASIRDIELSTSLTDALGRLTGDQRFSSASSLIGQHVTSRVDDQGQTTRGIVLGVRFSESGAPVLQLADGSEVPLDRVELVESQLRAAERLIGQMVSGLSREDDEEPELVEGVVSGVATGADGEVIVQLDTGDQLRFRDVLGVATGAEAAE